MIDNIKLTNFIDEIMIFKTGKTVKRDVVDVYVNTLTKNIKEQNIQKNQLFLALKEVKNSLTWENINFSLPPINMVLNLSKRKILPNFNIIQRDFSLNEQNFKKIDKKGYYLVSKNCINCHKELKAKFDYNDDDTIVKRSYISCSSCGALTCINSN